MIKIKICGLQKKEDLEIVNRYDPDYIGFVFAKSKRQITKEEAKYLKQMLNPQIKVVGVFVDESLAKIGQIAGEEIIDVVQLHGEEDERYIKELKNLVKLPIIKAFKIQSELDIKKANTSKADKVLLDYKKAGSGKSFDWSLLKGMKRTYFLAGGIQSNNLNEALKLPKLEAIDLSSGVETKDQKDEKK
ncbi:MAG TPA: phosphoribosylanthranilate isomerase [Candidatus Dorea intestinavium]|nr:phosphoribosylanthranilate isomerase [Candidatus Dorea intestinavium]